ncbi:MAG: glutaredoxin family protein [Elusimicrobia bacterium]|nr:glutaredoxin family protein [Elusimicrobiota bacterium]
MKVKLYTTPTCPFCTMAESFFKENSIEFEAVNVAEDRDALEEMREKSGQSGVPVIDVGGEIVIGFKRGQLKELLGIE